MFFELVLKFEITVPQRRLACSHKMKRDDGPLRLERMAQDSPKISIPIEVSCKCQSYSTQKKVFIISFR